MNLASILDPAACLFAIPVPGAPVPAVIAGGVDFAPVFDGAVTDLLAAPPVADGVGILPGARQKPAADGKALPVPADPAVIASVDTPDFSAAVSAVPGAKAEVSPDKPAVIADQDEDPAREPALAWLLPPTLAAPVVEPAAPPGAASARVVSTSVERPRPAIGETPPAAPPVAAASVPTERPRVREIGATPPAPTPFPGLVNIAPPASSSARPALPLAGSPASCSLPSPERSVAPADQPRADNPPAAKPPLQDLPPSLRAALGDTAKSAIFAPLRSDGTPAQIALAQTPAAVTDAAIRAAVVARPAVAAALLDPAPVSPVVGAAPTAPVIIAPVEWRDTSLANLVPGQPAPVAATPLPNIAAVPSNAPAATQPVVAVPALPNVAVSAPATPAAGPVIGEPALAFTPSRVAAEAAPAPIIAVAPGAAPVAAAAPIIVAQFAEQPPATRGPVRTAPRGRDLPTVGIARAGQPSNAEAHALARIVEPAVEEWRPAPRPAAFEIAAQPAAVIATPLRPAETAGAPTTGIDLSRDHGLHRMIDRIETLRDAADAKDTRIRLVPDSLGPVDISVRRSSGVGSDAVQVHFTATEAATRQLIADAQPRLTELAEARGVRIERATVDGGAPSGQLSGQLPGQTQHQQPHTNHAATLRNRAAATADTETTNDERIA